VFKREKCSCLLMYFLENGSRELAASVGVFVRRAAWTRRHL
jgi:hypothetical protein